MGGYTHKSACVYLSYEAVDALNFRTENSSPPSFSSSLGRPACHLTSAMLLTKWLSKSIIAQAVTSLIETSQAIPFNDFHHQISHTKHSHPRDVRARDNLAPRACTSPGQRREWRSLSTAEQEEYISAVKCLATKPSRLNLTSTLYDDFPYVHNELNSNSQSTLFHPQVLQDHLPRNIVTNSHPKPQSTS